MLGPPDLPPGAVEWYAKVFREISKSQEWKDWMAKGAMQPTFMTGDEFAAWLCGFEKGHVELMQALDIEFRDDWEPRGACPSPS